MIPTLSVRSHWLELHTLGWYPTGDLEEGMALTYMAVHEQGHL